jgi:predicted dienelactone hydrolase
VRRNRFSLCFYAALTLSVAFLPDALRPEPVHSAERIHFTVGPLDLTISVDSLETFVETGEVTPELRRYTRYLDDQTLEELQPLLQQSFEVSHVAVAQLAYSPIGETFLQQLGEVIQTQSRQNGFYAIRAALIQAAQDPEGITLINVIRYFPTEGLRINTRQVQELVQEFRILLEYQDATLRAIEQQAALEATEFPSDFTQLADLTQPGEFAVVRQTVTITDGDRPGLNGQSGRVYDTDFYFPQNVPSSAPVIAISHGLGSNRDEFSELAMHLASYGFAVVVPEHIGSNTQFREDALSGLFYQLLRPEEFIDRPIDITVALNQLERYAQENPDITGQLDLNSVGVIGHSFGGYTALALAGAELNPRRLAIECRADQINLNISLLLQCLATELPPAPTGLSDPRVQAVIAMSPVPSAILGPEGMAVIDRPTFIIAADNDFVAPAIAEQIYPFTWLTTPERYLAVLSPASHLTVIDSIFLDTTSPLDELLIGPSGGLGSQYTQALSVAFMNFYLNDRADYQPYLSADYAEFLSQEPVQLNLIRSLTREQLEAAYGDTPPQVVRPLFEE